VDCLSDQRKKKKGKKESAAGKGGTLRRVGTTETDRKENSSYECLALNTCKKGKKTKKNPRFSVARKFLRRTRQREGGRPSSPTALAQSRRCPGEF